MLKALLTPKAAQTAQALALIVLSAALPPAFFGGCKPPAQGGGDNASEATADASGDSALPILVTASDETDRYYLYTATTDRDEIVRLCEGGTLAACEASEGDNGRDPRDMTPIKKTNTQTFHASKELTLKSGQEATAIHLVARRGAATARTRSFRILRAEETITLASPVERQIFQRTSRDEGKVVVAVSAEQANGARYLQARVTGLGQLNNARAPGEWREIEVRDNQVTRMAIPSPAGAWFSVEAILLNADRTRMLGRAVVKQIGVGEVFLVAGQSNSSNCGRVPQKAQSDYVTSTDGERWQQGDDPQIGTHDDHLCNEQSGHGGSNWPATGRALVSRYRVPVAFASTGYSGTAIKQWAPTETQAPAKDDKGMSLFAYTLRRAEQLEPGGIRAVLWHQGENDAVAKTTAADYQAGLTAVIRGLRDRLRVETPWLIAAASWCPANPNYGPEWTGQPSAEIISAQQSMVSLRVLPELYAGPATDDIGERYRGTINDPADCHFGVKSQDTNGLQLAGDRWADSISAFLDSKIP